MIDCSVFLAGHSDFRDGLLDAAALTAFTDHLDSCASCARYDRVVADGLHLLQRLPELRASSDFEARLERRLQEVDDEILHAENASGASVSLTVAIAVAMAAAAWLPLIRTERAPVVLPPAVAHAPSHPQLLPIIVYPGPAGDFAEGRAHRAAYAPSARSAPYSVLETAAASGGRARLAR